MSLNFFSWKFIFFYMFLKLFYSISNIFKRMFSIKFIYNMLDMSCINFCVIILWVSILWVSILWVSILWVSILWVSILWVSILWVSILWVSILWVSILWVSILCVLILWVVVPVGFGGCDVGFVIVFEETLETSKETLSYSLDSSLQHRIWLKLREIIATFSFYIKY